MSVLARPHVLALGEFPRLATSTSSSASSSTSDETAHAHAHTAPHRRSIVSWNILCDRYVTPKRYSIRSPIGTTHAEYYGDDDAEETATTTNAAAAAPPLEWTPEEAEYMPWPRRVERIRERLVQLDADILCLQEIDLVHFDAEHAARMREYELQRRAAQLRRAEEEQKKKQKKQQQQQTQQQAQQQEQAELPSSSSSPASSSPSPPPPDDETSRDDFGAFLRARGYHVVVQELKNNTRGHRVGLAIAFRTALADLHSTNSRSRTMIATLSLKRRSDASSSPPSPSPLLIVGTVHLEGHPEAISIRQQQMSSLLAHMHSVRTQLHARPATRRTPCAYVIAGDFNSTPRSTIHPWLRGTSATAATVSAAATSAQLLESPWQSAYDAFVPEMVSTNAAAPPVSTAAAAAPASTAPTSSSSSPAAAASEMAFATFDSQSVSPTEQFSFVARAWHWRSLLDYIYFATAATTTSTAAASTDATSSLTCTAVLRLHRDKSEMHEMITDGLPNRHHPSDHLPVGAVLEWHYREDHVE